MGRSSPFGVPLALAAVLLAGCGSDQPVATPVPSTPAATTSPPATPPPPATPVPTPTRAGARCAPAEAPALRLTTKTGATLAAVEIGSGTRGIVLGHQSDGGLCDLFGLGQVLAEQGYRVVALDFEGYGLSSAVPPPAPGSSGGFRPPYADDLLAGVAHLRATGTPDVALIGASMGGAAAVVAAAQDPSVKAVVDLSGPASYFGLDSAAAARTSAVPQLLVGTRSDRSVDAADLQAVHDASTAQDRQILLLEGSQHGRQLVGASEPGPSVRARVLAFLAAHLP